MGRQYTSVMQVIGTLDIGGAERMAVNLANLLPRDRFIVHLCSLRSEGPLAAELDNDVGRLALERKSRLGDIRAVWKLVRYIKSHKIRIIHCHNYTVFLCSLAALICPTVVMVWHDHNSPAARPRWLYRIGTMRARAVIAVSDQLADWAVTALRFSSDDVHVVRNFVAKSPSKTRPTLPLTKGPRIVMVANLYWAKGVIDFVKAIARVASAEPNVQALLIGGAPDPEYLESIESAITDLGLRRQIILMGQRSDVAEILAQSDIGVISSVSEGLPLALIEYGMAGLAAVATRVGQCADVLENGRLGILVPPQDSDALADAILRLVRSKSDRESFGRAFKRAALDRYSPDQNIREIAAIYDSILRT